jgi:hypothetical protein
MGLIDSLRGIKRPHPELAPVSKNLLKEKMLGLGGEKTPFKITESEETDILVELKVVDAEWYEFFAKAGLKKTYRIYLLLDDAKKEVRALEKIGEVSWKKGVPTISYSKSSFQGRTIAYKEFGTSYAFKEPKPSSFGKVYEYSFDVNDLKNPLIEITTSSGWSYVPVTSMRKVKKR